MIFQKLRLKKGASTIEYMAMIVFILGALFVFEKYIMRGLWGKWKQAGDSFGHGKEYDPRPFGNNGEGGGTLECLFVYDEPAQSMNPNGTWVDRECFDREMLTPGADLASSISACDQGALPEVGYCNY